MNYRLEDINIEYSNDLLEIFQDYETLKHLSFEYISNMDMMEDFIMYYFYKSKDEDLPLAKVIIDDTNKVIGIVELHTKEDSKYEVGIYLNSRYHKNNVGTVCLKMFIDLYKDKYKVFLFKCFDNNVGAISLAKKLDFIYVGNEYRYRNFRKLKVNVFELKIGD